MSRGNRLKKEQSRARDAREEQNRRGWTPQERFRGDAELTERSRTETGRPVYSTTLQKWMDASPGTNVMVSPPLSQQEANAIAQQLMIPLPSGNITHIGGNHYSIHGPITPDMAFLWLDKFNVQNRVPGRANFQAISRDIDTGGWIPNHQAIAFIVSREGGKLTPILADGQHRARGIHEAGYPVMATVTLNVLPEAVRVMDTHMIRNVRSIINLGGKNMRFVMEGAVKLAILGIAPPRKVTPNELWWFAQQFMPVLDRVNDLTSKTIRNITLASVLAVVIRAILSRPSEEHERIYEFLRILQDGPTGKDEDKAAQYFRDWLQTKRKPRTQARDIYLRTTKQLELFLKGQSQPDIRAAKFDPFLLPDRVERGLRGQWDDADEAEKTAPSDEPAICS